MCTPTNMFTYVKENDYCNRINKKGEVHESTDECLFYL